MLRLKMFAVYDTASEAYSTPFFCPTTGLAEREFTKVAMNPETTVFQHAADFCLFELGEFEVMTGKYSPLAAPLNLGTALVFQSRELVNRRRTEARMSDAQVVENDDRSEQEEML